MTPEIEKFPENMTQAEKDQAQYLASIQHLTENELRLGILMRSDELIKTSHFSSISLMGRTIISLSLTWIPARAMPMFVAMHYGNHNNQRNIYILSPEYWKRLGRPENKKARVGLLMYEMTKAESWEAKKDGVAHAIHVWPETPVKDPVLEQNGNTQTDKTDLRKHHLSELKSAQDYQKRSIQLLHLIDTEDRSGQVAQELINEDTQSLKQRKERYRVRATHEVEPF